MTQSRITITASPQLLAALDARNEMRSQSVATIVDRYATLMRVITREINEVFGPGERALIRDALNGTAFLDSISPQLVDAEISDALPELAGKWDVDAEAMRGKLGALGVAQKYALVDAVERWWRNDAASEDDKKRDPRGEF
jgi:hypothetical protein